MELSKEVKITMKIQVLIAIVWLVFSWTIVYAWMNYRMDELQNDQENYQKYNDEKVDRIDRNVEKLLDLQLKK